MNPSSEELLLQAEISYSENNYEKGYHILERLFETDKNYYAAFGLMGKILYKLEKFNGSEMYITKAIHYDPEDFESITFLGKLKYKQKKYDVAKELFEESKKINPNYDKNYYYLGLIEELDGNESEAQNLFIESFRSSYAIHTKSLRKIKNRNDCLDIIEHVLLINDGLVQDVMWSNLTYILTDRSNFIPKLFKHLKNISLSELDYLSLIREYKLEKENFNKLLDFIFRYYDIPEEVFSKLDALINSKFFKI